MSFPPPYFSKRKNGAKGNFSICALSDVPSNANQSNCWRLNSGSCSYNDVGLAVTQLDQDSQLTLMLSRKRWNLILSDFPKLVNMQISSVLFILLIPYWRRSAVFWNAAHHHPITLTNTLQRWDNSYKMCTGDNMFTSILYKSIWM